MRPTDFLLFRQNPNSALCVCVSQVCVRPTTLQVSLLSPRVEDASIFHVTGARCGDGSPRSQAGSVQKGHCSLTLQSEGKNNIDQ